MKKIFLSLFVLVLSMATLPAHAGFEYEAGAELVSSYVWRGQYNGGLSLQPEVLIGFDTENTSFRIGAWGSIGASDWRFSEFYPEIDIVASLQLWGLVVGFSHYYYCEGDFFSFGKIDEVMNSEAYSQTEVQLGYTRETAIGSPYINWYTMVSGADGYLDEATNQYKRAFSSYIELGFTFELPLDITLDVQLGMTPWRSLYTGYEGKFAVNNIAARLDVPFTLGHVLELDVFAQGSINTYNMEKDNVFIHGVGEEKTLQRLNACVGLGIWF